MNSHKFLILAFLPMALTAQELRDMVPLRNWSNPLYYQPKVERELTSTPAPELQFSPTAVSTNALTFVAVTPCRLVDTRGLPAGFNGNVPFSGPSIASGATLTIPVQLASEATANTAPAPCGVIPSIAQAYSFNIAVIPQGGGAVSFVTIWPSGATKPVVATINDKTGLILDNAAIVPAGTPNGGISIYNNGPSTTDIVLDMNGFFAAPTDLNGNTAIGTGSLLGNTTGTNNTATGSGALQANTTGSDNTANGAVALRMNTTGSGDTANGYAALAANTTGIDNTAVGQGALTANTVGGSNTAVGFGALQLNTSGANDTATGYQALMNNATGTNNEAHGYQALFGNTTGSFNTATGYQALLGNSTGSGNIAIGGLAGYNAPVGNGNSIYIGSQGFITDASGVIRIGHREMPALSSRLQFGASQRAMPTLSPW